MRYWVGGVIAFFVALVQTSSVEQFHALGVTPNLMLVLLVAWLVVRGLDDVLPMVAVSGITIGFLGLQTPGLVLLAMLIPIAALAAVREMHILHGDALLTCLLAGAATLMYELIMLAGVMATGGVLDIRSGLFDVVLPAAIVNVALTPPVYFVMRLAKPPMRTRSAYL